MVPRDEPGPPNGDPADESDDRSANASSDEGSTDDGSTNGATDDGSTNGATDDGSTNGATDDGSTSASNDDETTSASSREDSPNAPSDDPRSPPGRTQDGGAPGTEGHDPLTRSSRRRVLQIAAAAGALPAIGATASAQDENRIQLGGDTVAWQGIAPDEIEGEENPTLELTDGETYVVEWANVDGQPHNFAILDADENELVRSELISERGETQTVEFQATRAMAEYYCEVHPESMRGDVAIGEGTAEADEEPAQPAEEPGEDDGEPDEEEADDARFFEAGTEVGLTTVAEGMTAPTDFAVAGLDLAYVTDQTGEVWLVDEDGRREEPAIDVGDRMVAIAESFAGSYADPEQDYDERGLLGVETHPDFEENGRLFLHYSAPPNDETPEGWSHVEVISEFATADGGETIDPDSERVLMAFQKPQYNHDGGPIAFGPDGYLYVPMGDGGGANDEMYGHVEDWHDENAGGNGQDTTETLLGGVHRIDVDETGEDRPYGIPDDNPLVDVEGHRDEYYAWGLRNPFGITFDSAGNQIVADAGQNLFEEANLVHRGGNYGWNVKEGTHCFSTDDPGRPPTDCPSTASGDLPEPRAGEPLLDPVVEYPHNYEGTPVGIVVAGGHVYEADAHEALQGAYVFGDWTRDVARQTPDGRLFAARPRDDELGPDAEEPLPRDDSTLPPPASEVDEDEVVPRDQLWEMEELVIAGTEDGTLGRFVRQFGQGPGGDVFVLVSERGVPQGDTGAVLRIVPPEEGEALDPPDLSEAAQAEGDGGDEGGEGAQSDDEGAQSDDEEANGEDES